MKAKLLIMVIFPKSVKSLEDQTLRHFSRATNFFSKLSFVEASESHEKGTSRQTHFVDRTVQISAGVIRLYERGVGIFKKPL